MNQSTSLWTRTQLDANLSRLEEYTQHPCFKRDALFTSLTQSTLIQLILRLDELLQQAQRAGRRIDFLDEVGTNGRIEDITSLIHDMSQAIQTLHQQAQSSRPDPNTSPLTINYFYGAGVGYFANGLFFSCTHEDELAFFVDCSRVYFYRHLVRAMNEAKVYLQAVIRL